MTILILTSLRINAQTLKYMLVNNQGVVVFKGLDINACKAHLGNKAKDGWSCVPQQWSAFSLNKPYSILSIKKSFVMSDEKKNDNEIIKLIKFLVYGLIAYALIINLLPLLSLIGIYSFIK